MKNIILEGKSICKVFAQGQIKNTVLDKIDVDIYEKDFTIIMGSSGAGKSTLWYALSGMDAVTKGTVTYKGKEISRQMKDGGKISSETGFPSYSGRRTNNMENKIICRAGIRRHKGTIWGIAVLLFLTALSLSTVLTVYLGGDNYIRQEMQRVGFGNLTAWVSDVPDMEALTEIIRTLEGIERTEVQNLIFSEYEANGVESDSEGQLIPWSNQEGTYRFFRDDLSGYKEFPEEIATGTVYVSPSMISIMELKIGDTITFPVARDGDNKTLTVAGYYEDPLMGSSMIGMKGFLISEADYGAIRQTIETAGMGSLARNGAMLHIFTTVENDINAGDIRRNLNENTPISQYAEFMHSEAAIRGFMGILQNAFCALLAAFSLILLGAAMVVLGHSITGIIEQDYKNMGILKTIGFTGNRLIRLQMFQYLLSIGAGILLGILAAIPAAGAAGQLTLTATGVLIPGDLPVLPCAAAFTVIFLLLSGFTIVKLRKLLSVTPMRVIRGERLEMKWEPGRTFQMKAEGLPFQLAMRKLQSGKRNDECF